MKILDKLKRRSNMVKYDTIEELIKGMDANGIQEFQYASDEIKGNPDDIKKVLKKFLDDGIFQYVSDDLKKSKEFIFRFDGYGAFQYAADELKDDREFVLQLLTRPEDEGFCWLNIQYVSERLKHDREFVLVAVENYGKALAFLDSEFKNDREVVLEAVKSDATAIAYIGEDLKDDGASILAQGIREGKKEYSGSFWRAFPVDKETIERFKENKDIIIALISRANLGDMSLNSWASKDLVKSKEFILEAMHYAVENSDEMADRIRDGRYAPEDVVTDKLQSLLRQMDESLKGDEEIARYAIGHGADLICVGKELRDNPELRTLSEEVKKKKVYHFYSASDVAEIDGIKTSDIQSVYEETIVERNSGKEDKSPSISEE